MGQAGEFGVVTLEEGMELHGGGVVDDCPHGFSSQRFPEVEHSYAGAGSGLYQRSVRALERRMEDRT
jgi:hypothetical protein